MSTGPGEPTVHVLYYTDPLWAPTDEEPDPPLNRIVGGWTLAPGGWPGPFEANPAYEPLAEGSPTDPVDAVLQLVDAGDGSAGDLVEVLRDAVVDVALGEDGGAVVAPAPDGAGLLLAVTAPTHRPRVQAAGWLGVTAAELAEWLPADGVDVVLNPGRPYARRLPAGTFRAAAA